MQEQQRRVALFAELDELRRLGRALRGDRSVVADQAAGVALDAQKLDSQSTALYGTASLWDDGLVDPRDSRRLLGYLLDICAEAEARPLKGNSFGVARF